MNREGDTARGKFKWERPTRERPACYGYIDVKIKQPPFYWKGSFFSKLDHLGRVMIQAVIIILFLFYYLFSFYHLANSVILFP